MTRNLASIVLETHAIFTQYAQNSLQADAEALDNQSACIFARRPIEKIPLIEALLPEGGVLGIRQSVNTAEPGDHAHNHELYLGKFANNAIYLFQTYDDESRWNNRKEIHNAKIHQSHTVLSHTGGHFNKSHPLSRPSKNKVRTRSANKTMLYDLMLVRLEDELQGKFFRIFQEDYWHFNKSGEPVMRAIVTTDGKTTQPYDTLHLLKTIYAVGGHRTRL